MGTKLKVDDEAFAIELVLLAKRLTREGIKSSHLQELQHLEGGRLLTCEGIREKLSQNSDKHDFLSYLVGKPGESMVVGTLQYHHDDGGWSVYLSPSLFAGEKA